jgi:hypothetical protein
VGMSEAEAANIALVFGQVWTSGMLRMSVL